MPNYTSSTNIQNFLGRALTTYETTALSGYILSTVDKIIDRMLNTTFFDVQPSTRYFNGGSHSIDIDPCQSITALGSLNNDGSASYSYTDLTEYVAEPVNEDVKREIVYRGRRRRFPAGLRRMSLTAKFTEYDYTNTKVPDDIVMVATRLAAGILNAGRMAGKGGNLHREELEGHMVQYDITNIALQTLMASDPIIQSIIGARREIYLYDVDNDGYDDDEEPW